MNTVRILTSLASFVIAGSLQISPGLAAGPPAAAGDNFFGGHIEVTFTKWVTGPGPAPSFASMVGVVSGDVGPGRFEGEIITREDTGDITYIHALYHIKVEAYGGAYTFTADNYITSDDVAGRAVIKGTVISDGPLKGARVQGEYQIISAAYTPYPCAVNNDTCFQGTLVVRPGLEPQ